MKKNLNKATLSELKKLFEGRQILKDIEIAECSEEFSFEILVIEAQRAIVSVQNDRFSFVDKEFAKHIFEQYNAFWQTKK